jgi:hypothetical protein
MLIARSINQNTVLYYARVENGKICALEFHWRMSDGSTEKCNIIERSVYGFKVVHKTDHCYRILFNKFKDKIINVEITGPGRVQATIVDDDGNLVIVKSLFVKCGILPSIKSVHLIGVKNNRKTTIKIK